MFEVTASQCSDFRNGIMPTDLDEDLDNDISYMLEKDGRALVGFDKGGFKLWASVVECDALCEEELNEILDNSYVMIVHLDHIDGVKLAVSSNKMEFL